MTMKITPDLSFSPKRPEDVERFSINFAKLLPAGVTISAATVDVVGLNGAAPNTQSMVQGVAAIDGLIVSALVGGGQSSTTYGVRFQVDGSDGQHLMVIGSLLVRD
jgi:hypothetical protein